jgi:PHD/YefM family antitoxin component YafN of YafNO toxin-antitoxin module
MRTIELTTASRPLSDYARDLGDEVVILTSRRKPVAALVSLSNIERETLALGMSAEFMEIIRRAREEFSSGRRLSLGEMKQECLA